MNLIQTSMWGILRAGYGRRLSETLNVQVMESDPEPNEPFVLLANHAHRMDPVVIGSFLKRPVRYMANLGGVALPTRTLAPLVGAYGKRKGMSDLKALRATLEFFRAGDSIGIFPEGDRSWDGETGALKPGIEKLVKKLGGPVRMVRQVGNYLSGPRWATEERRGTYLLHVRTLSKEFVRDVNAVTLRQTIEDFLSVNDLKEMELEGVEYSCPSPASGISRLLWRCPVCGAQDKIQGAWERLWCQACGERWAVDAHQRVARLGGHPTTTCHAGSSLIEDLKDWNDWQRSTIPGLRGGARYGEGGPSGFFAPRVRLMRGGAGKTHHFGEGSLSLYSDALIFRPEDNREPALKLNPDQISGFIDNFNHFQEFSHRGERYRLNLLGGNALKWEDALREKPIEGARILGSRDEEFVEESA